ncbi:MAG: hypothetical protein M5R36_20785 [Deltaproteobacteria bacterium]|nr:hypothetical protein [Deltaproteobacteria bacterium]
MVAIIRPGGAHYLGTVIVPLVPLLVGLWNLPRLGRRRPRALGG